VFFVLFVFVLCVRCCQCLWIVHYWFLPSIFSNLLFFMTDFNSHLYFRTIFMLSPLCIVVEIGQKCFFICFNIHLDSDVSCVYIFEPNLQYIMTYHLRLGFYLKWMACILYTGSTRQADKVFFSHSKP
jgi:hypothetical protein